MSAGESYTTRVPGSAAEMRAELEARGFSPRHRFGQNFMVRGAAIDRIVDAADVKDGDLVLEIGPGLGALTARLLDAGARVIAAEIDRGLAAFARETFTDAPFRLVEGDAVKKGSPWAPALATVLAEEGETYKLVTNLPYGISSPVVSGLATSRGAPRCLGAWMTLQEEFAANLKAAPGTEEYGALSGLVALSMEVRSLGRLAPDAFWPQPGVHSALVELLPRPEGPPDPGVVALLRALMRRRRKSLRKALKEALKEQADPAEGRVAEILAAADLSGEERPAALEPQAYLGLHEAWKTLAP